jgi:hypothetical protein
VKLLLIPENPYILVAQSAVEGILPLTADPIGVQYPGIARKV